MSKKINISLSDRFRPNLLSLFRSYLSRKSREYSRYKSSVRDEYSSMCEYWDRAFPGWDDDFDMIYPYNDSNSSDDTGDYEPISKAITFYPNYHDKYDKIEFSSFKDFSEYCDAMGYYIDKKTEEDILSRYESHCCLRPLGRYLSFSEVLSAHSYGSMYYDVCDDEELSEDFWSHG